MTKHRREIKQFTGTAAMRRLRNAMPEDEDAAKFLCPGCAYRALDAADLSLHHARNHAWDDWYRDDDVAALLRQFRRVEDAEVKDALL